MSQMSIPLNDYRFSAPVVEGNDEESKKMRPTGNFVEA